MISPCARQTFAVDADGVPQGAAIIAFDRARDPTLFDVRRSVVTIGRSPQADFVVDHRSLSRLHLRLTFDGDGVVAVDLDSPQGTFVNGVRITGPHRLNEDDHISIGTVELKVVHR